MNTFCPGESVTLVRGISEMEKYLFGNGYVHFVVKRTEKKWGKVVVRDEWGSWWLNPEVLEKK